MPNAIKILAVAVLFPDGIKVERRVWRVPTPVFPCTHFYKYSLYCGRPGERLVGYDNERGKGDHKHILGEEYPYQFISYDTLLDDFSADILQHCGVRLDD